MCQGKVKFDPLLSWKLTESIFPTLGKLAWDVFAVQASSVTTCPFEVHLIDYERSRLGDESIVMLDRSVAIRAAATSSFG